MKWVDSSGKQRLWRAPAWLFVLSVAALTGCGGSDHSSGGSSGGGHAPTQYMITDLGMVGGTGFAPAGINTAGQMVGTSRLSSGILDAFLDSGITLTALGMPSGLVSCNGQAINTNGRAVGAGFPASGSPVQGCLFQGGSATVLGTLPGGTFCLPKAINTSGQIVGSADNSSGRSDAFLDSGGQMTDLGVLTGYVSSAAVGINDTGQMAVVEYSALFPNHSHSFLVASTNSTDLGTLPGYTDLAAMAINASGEIVGYGYSDAASHAFLSSSGKLTDLGVLPGFTNSKATAINTGGQVVGYCSGTSATATPSLGSAFLESGGQMIDLTARLTTNLGWTLDDAFGINDQGQICGEGTINGEEHGFLLTPVP